MSSLRSSIVGALLLLSACIAWTAPAQAPAANAPVPQQRELDLRARPWKGDFESEYEKISFCFVARVRHGFGELCCPC